MFLALAVDFDRISIPHFTSEVTTVRTIWNGLEEILEGDQLCLTATGPGEENLFGEEYLNNRGLVFGWISKV